MKFEINFSANDINWSLTSQDWAEMGFGRKLISYESNPVWLK